MIVIFENKKFLGYKANEEFLKTNPMIVLKAFFIITLLMISQLFSNLLISQMTLKISSEVINSLNDLIKFKITLMAPGISFINRMVGKKNEDMDELLQNSVKTKNMFDIREFISEDKWIANLCRGTHAIMFFEVPLKIRITKIASQIKCRIKIRSIDDSSRQNYGSIILNRNLNLKLRRDINKKYFIRNKIY